MGSFKVRFMMRVRKLKARTVDIVFSSDGYVKYRTWNKVFKSEGMSPT